MGFNWAFKGLNNIIKREYLIMGGQQLEDIFGILITKLRDWLNVLLL
jgi:hypothetical protein